jgi:hypothetical protein
MIVKILKACATPFGSFNEGEIVDIPGESATAWIKAEIAEPSREAVTVETTMLSIPIEKAVVNSVTDKKRQQTRERVARCRAKKKQS